MRQASLLLALGIAGCSLTLDADKKQCTNDDQCGLHEGKPLYACVENFCENVSCSADRECQARGSFICESDVCREAQCQKSDDCSKDGDVCVEGRCDSPVAHNPVFQCFYQKQPLTSSEPASLKLKLLSYGNQEPVKDLKVKVCSIADLACNTPISVETSYDSEGMLTIKGIDNGSRYSIRLSGTDVGGNPLMEAEYFMQRPVVGATQEADKLEMVPPGVVSVLALTAGASWNSEQGLVLTQVFGCDMKPLAGISLADSRSANLFYLTGAASTSTTETDGSGVGGFVNMEVGATGNAVQHKLTYSYGGRPLFSFSVAPRPKVMTFLQIYMGDYGTTTERASDFMR